MRLVIFSYVLSPKLWLRIPKD